MQRTLVAATLLSMVSAAGNPALAETRNLTNPDWREVPGTKPANEDFFATHVEINGLLKRGNNRVIDVIDGNGYYSRTEIGCNTKQYRILRQGTLETKTRVQYEEMDGNWLDSSRNVMGKVATFVCRR